MLFRWPSLSSADLSQLNLALPLQDGKQIDVPTKQVRRRILLLRLYKRQKRMVLPKLLLLIN